MSGLPLIPVGAETACSREEDEPDLLHGQFVPDYQETDMELPDVVATEFINMQKLKAAAKKVLGYLTPEQKRLRQEQAQEAFNRAEKDLNRVTAEYRAAQVAFEAADVDLKKAKKL